MLSHTSLANSRWTDLHRPSRVLAGAVECL